MIFAPQKAKPQALDGQVMESFWRALFVRQSHGRQAHQHIHRAATSNDASLWRQFRCRSTDRLFRQRPDVCDFQESAGDSSWRICSMYSQTRHLRRCRFPLTRGWTAGLGWHLSIPLDPPPWMSGRVW